LTIKSPNVDVDLYTPIEVAIAATVDIDIEV
jgi:hypothetical protein